MKTLTQVIKAILALFLAIVLFQTAFSVQNQLIFVKEMGTTTLITCILTILIATALLTYPLSFIIKNKAVRITLASIVGFIAILLLIGKRSLMLNENTTLNIMEKLDPVDYVSMDNGSIIKLTVGI